MTSFGTGMDVVRLTMFLVKLPGIPSLMTCADCNGCWGVDKVRLRRVESMLCALRSLASSILRLDSVSWAGDTDTVAALEATVVGTFKYERIDEPGV